MMIWDPPQKKGLSRAFQPKWNGPWKIIRFIGSTNCCIENERGLVKYLHLNLLKKVQARNPFYNESVEQTSVSGLSTNYTETVNEVELVDPDIFESVSEMVEDEQDSPEEDHIPRYLIDNAYVDISDSNIIERRLRRLS